MSESPGPGTLAALRQRLAKMLAIKLYRDATGAGPAVAKDADERMVARKTPVKGAAAPPVTPEARAVGEALRAGNRGEAIRLYRDATGAGLEAATAAIDAMIAEKQAGPRPTAPSAAALRPLNPVLLLLGLAVLFGTVFAIVILALGD